VPRLGPTSRPAASTPATAPAEGEHVHAGAEEPRAETGFQSARLIEPMGILTLSLVALTVGLGILRRRRGPRVMLRIHKVCGAAVLASGAVHATLVILLH